MAYGKPEQIDWWGNSRRYKKWLKLVAKRRRRRIEKAKLNDSPKRNEYHGWSV